MKILHVISCLSVGGAQRLISNLLPSLNKKEDITLLVYRYVNSDFEKELLNNGIKIISLNLKHTRNPLAIIKMRNIFKSYEIVHVHLFPTIYWASIAARGLNVKLVYTEHSTNNRRRNKFYLRSIEKFIYKRFDKIISISEQTQHNLSEWLQSKDDRFITINNGIDISRFANAKANVKENILIMVGRFAPAKDQATVIRALPLLNGNIRLRFVGDGNTRLDCENLAKELNVRDRIDFLGERSDIPSLIAESYIGIQSSFWEGFGLAAVEMMACGKPVIATDVDGLKDVVKEAGLLFPVGDEKKLAECINSLIKDRKYYCKVAENCKERSKIYNSDKMANDYINVYHSLNNTL